jgi:RNA polymerase sigma-70 factor, ECF subfamily
MTHFIPERDRALLDAVARGDTRALEGLYLNYASPLTAFVSRFVRGNAIAEEVINDTLMVVWRTAKDFRNESKVSTWVFGIAYRVALKSVRRRLPSSLAIPDQWKELATDPSGESELRDWLSCGLSQLPAEQRLAMELSYQLGHSLEEIAAITGSPIGTVKARLFHARNRLRRHLPRLGGHDYRAPTGRGT